MNMAITFGMRKAEWCGYPMVKNFARFNTNVADRQTDTAPWHRSCLRGKKTTKCYSNEDKDVAHILVATMLEMGQQQVLLSTQMYNHWQQMGLVQCADVQLSVTNVILLY